MLDRMMIYGPHAREKFKKGVDAIANAVKVTMGPSGKLVAIDRGIGAGTMTKDGVTVAKAVTVKDKVENLAVEQVKEASSKTNDEAGDGTTATCVLAQGVYSEAIQLVAAGKNPVLLKRGIEEGIRYYSERVTKVAKKVNDKATLVRVATISANDEGLGELVADVMDRVGKDGVVTVEESENTLTSFEIVNGAQIDSGYCNPYFITRADRMESELREPLILVCDRRVTDQFDIIPAMEIAKAAERPLVVLAEDVEASALQCMVQNKLRGGLLSVAVKAPSFGSRRKEMLEDIAALTGATLVSEETGLKLKDVKKEHLGTARTVLTRKDRCIIVGGAGSKSALAKRLKYLDAQIAEETEQYEKERLRERKAKLRGGVGLVKVGDYTESRLKEKKQRVEDAIYATKGAMLDGIVPGGGWTLAKLAQEKPDIKLSPDLMDGFEIVRKALTYPLKQISENCGKNGDVILAECYRRDVGYDAAKGEYGDLVKMGVIDPALVVRSALQNGGSVAAMLLTTECAVVNEPEEETIK